MPQGNVYEKPAPIISFPSPFPVDEIPKDADDRSVIRTLAPTANALALPY